MHPCKYAPAWFSDIGTPCLPGFELYRIDSNTLPQLRLDCQREVSHTPHTMPECVRNPGSCLASCPQGKEGAKQKLIAQLHQFAGRRALCSTTKASSIKYSLMHLLLAGWLDGKTLPPSCLPSLFFPPPPSPITLPLCFPYSLPLSPSPCKLPLLSPSLPFSLLPSGHLPCLLKLMPSEHLRLQPDSHTKAAMSCITARPTTVS